MSSKGCRGCEKPCHYGKVHKSAECLKLYQAKKKCLRCGGLPVILNNYVFNYCLQNPDCAKNLLIEEAFPYTHKIQAEKKEVEDKVWDLTNELKEKKEDMKDLENKLYDKKEDMYRVMDDNIELRNRIQYFEEELQNKISELIQIKSREQDRSKGREQEQVRGRKTERRNDRQKQNTKRNRSDSREKQAPRPREKERSPVRNSKKAQRVYEQVDMTQRFNPNRYDAAPENAFNTGFGQVKFEDWLDSKLAQHPK